MEIILFSLLAAAATLAATMAVKNKQAMAHSVEPWRVAAERLGVECKPSSSFLERRIQLDGHVNGVRVHVVYIFDRNGGSTRFNVYLRSGAARRFTLRVDNDGVLNRNRGMPGMNDQLIGDPSFDDQVFIQGNAIAARAVLGLHAREACISWFSEKRFLADGILTNPIEYAAAVVDPEPIMAEINDMLALEMVLRVREGEIAARLEHNAVHDEVEEVRKRCFTALLKKYETSLEAKQASQKLLECGDPKSRFLAAKHLGLPIAESGSLSMAAPEGGDLALSEEGGLSISNAEDNESPD